MSEKFSKRTAWTRSTLLCSEKTNDKPNMHEQKCFHNRWSRKAVTPVLQTN